MRWKTGCMLLVALGGLFANPQVRGQAAATPPNVAAEPPESFDVASIHVNKTSTDGHNHIYSDPNDSHFRTVNVSVMDLLQFAYGMPASQIVGGPAWLSSTEFDIDAKCDGAADERMRTLSSEEGRAEKQRLLQRLLADRFGVKVHHETRELPIYALVLAKGGAKFKSSKVNGTTLNTGRDHIEVRGGDDSIALLARYLARELGRPVIDRTGIPGRYELMLRWTRADAVAAGGPPNVDAPPDIFTAIQEQLGLRLESTKGPVPVLVIDAATLPTEN